MNTFQRILVYQPAEGAVSASLKIAARLSRQAQTRVTVVDVRQEDLAWWEGIVQDESISFQIDKAEQLDSLNSMIDDIDVGDDVHVKILEGRPIDVLIDEAFTGAYDLILKDAESKAENLFFGSLDLRLLRLAPMAVWIADGNAPTKTRRILAAIDPHVRGDEMHLNERVVQFASSLARQDSAELHVVSAWYMPGDSGEVHRDGFKRHSKSKEAVRRRAWGSVEHAVSKSSQQIPSDRILFEEGPPGDTVVSAVLRLQPDLLVMGSVTHRGVPGLWIGDTTEEVTRQVECSVLTTKPKDFEFILPSQPRRTLPQ